MYSPLALVIVTRMVFGSFMETERFEYGWPSCVGINVDSADWDTRQRLMRQGGRTRAMAADYGYFDSLSSDQVLELVTRFTDAYYGNVGPKHVRHFILRNCMKANLVLGQYIVEKVVGGTTGNPLTVHWNNLMNEFFLRCAYRGKAMEMGLEPFYSPATFDREVYLCVYGDDNTSTFTPAVESFYNFTEV